jgi:hypothetical protein
VTPLEEKEALFQMKGQASDKTSLRKVLLPFDTAEGRSEISRREYRIKE